jgi:hypothetical protein
MLETLCFCPLCDLPITQDMFDLKVVADNYVYKAGELAPARTTPQTSDASGAGTSPSS